MVKHANELKPFLELLDEKNQISTTCDVSHLTHVLDIKSYNITVDLQIPEVESYRSALHLCKKHIMDIEK